MEVNVFVQAGAKAMDEGDCADVQCCLFHIGRTRAVGLQTLADCKDGLGAIKSLDLGFSFLVSGYDYHNTDIGNDIALMATYAMNLAEFISRP
jgi:hypothetical protein